MDRDFTICDCGCHRLNSSMKHALACCLPCPRCKKNVKHGFNMAHDETCQQK